MTPKKLFYGMIGVLSLATIFTIGGVVFGMGILEKKAAELTELKIQDRLIEEQQIALVQANKDIEEYEELEAIAKAIVPQDKDQAKTIREINTLATLSGIRINSINFPSSTLGTKPAAPAGETSTGSTTAASQLKPVKGIKDLYEMEVTVNVSSPNSTTYPQLIDFMSRLEQNRRTAQVTELSILPVPENRNLLNFVLTLKVFVRDIK